MALRIVWIALAAAFAVFVVMLIVLWRNRETKQKLCFSHEMGAAIWNPSASSATTFTTFGSLLSAVLVYAADAEIPATPLSKGEYVGLSIFFATLLVLAPILYNAWRCPEKNEKSVEYHGWVGTFVLFSLITMWAVTGQLITVWFLIGAFAKQGPLPTVPAWLFQGVIVVSGLSVISHTWQFLHLGIVNTTATPDAASLRETVRAARRPTWPVL